MAVCFQVFDSTYNTVVDVTRSSAQSLGIHADLSERLNTIEEDLCRRYQLLLVENIYIYSYWYVYFRSRLSLVFSPYQRSL